MWYLTVHVLYWQNDDLHVRYKCFVRFFTELDIEEGVGGIEMKFSAYKYHIWSELIVNIISTPPPPPPSASTPLHPPLKYVNLDNTDLCNLIGQLQVSNRSRNLERDSKCQWGEILSARGT